MKCLSVAISACVMGLLMGPFVEPANADLAQAVAQAGQSGKPLLVIATGGG